MSDDHPPGPSSVAAMLLLSNVSDREAVFGLLGKRGVASLAVGSVEEALDRWDKGIRVLVVDAAFADRAGPLVERARAGRARILAAGTGLQGVDVLSLIEAGARGYLPMPRDPELLAREVAEQVAREEEERGSAKRISTAKSELQAVFDTFPSPLVVVGTDMKIRRFNRAALELSGHRDFPELIGADFGATFGCTGGKKEELQRRLATGTRLLRREERDIEWSHPVLGRSYRARIMTGGRNVDPDRNLGDGMLIQIEDATAIRRRESENLREQRLNAVGLLAATLSHEINQPLGAIMGRAQLALIGLEREPPDVEAIRKDLDEVVLNVTRVSEILEKLHQVTDIVTKPYLGEMEILDLERSSKHPRGET